MAQQSGPFAALYEDLKAGRISRRDFLHRAPCSASAAPVALFVVNQSLRPSPPRMRHPAAGGAPASGTEGQTRGAGGELKILQWQGVTHFGLHTATGTKDQLGASLVHRTTD